MTLENLNSTIIYRDVLSGVDVEYVLTANDIKENIIVKEKAEEYTYSFTLKLNNLTATLTESGDVLIMNGEQVAYEIPAPVIYDANGTYADTGVGVYTLTDNGGGSYTLTVAVSSAWMNSADRAFPVTVDPTLQAKLSNQLMAYMQSSACYINPDTMTLTNTNEIYWQVLNLDFLPRKAYITNAELKFYAIPTTASYIGAYQVTSAWDNTMTYDTIATYSNNVISYTHTGAYSNWIGFDVTDVVKNWWANSSNNHGIALKILESENDEQVVFRGIYTTKAPVFMVSYRNLYGLEDYLAYSSHSIGAGASGHVNLATGNLTLAIPTLTTTDALIGFTPTLYYNSSMLGKYNRYMHAEVPYAYHAVGVGFKWNMQQSVIKKNNSNASAATAQYYVWADGDGTEHALKYEPDEDGYYHIVDEDGLQLTYNDLGDYFTITDRNGTVMLFSLTDVPEKAVDIDAAWTLTSITDKIGNKLIFEYDTKWRPTKVYVQPNGAAPIKMLEITYSGNALKEITNSITGDKVVFKNSMEYNGEITEAGYVYLREIEWVNGGEVVSELQFDYNYEGLILGVTEAVSNYSIDYGYTGKRLKTVTESAGGEIGQKVHYNYGVGYTDVRTSGSDDIYGNGDDIITRNILDNMGRCVSAYAKSADNTEFFGAASGAYESQENVKNSLKEQHTVNGSPTNYILNGGFGDLGVGSFTYWGRSRNVIIDTSDSYDDYYAAKITPDVNRTDYISQEVFLKTGEYVFSFDLKTENAANVSIKVSVRSLAGSGLNTERDIIATGNVDWEDYFLMSSTGITASVKINVPNHINAGDRVELKISVSAGEEIEEDEFVIIDRVMLTEGSISEYSMITCGAFEIGKADEWGDTQLSPSRFWDTEKRGFDAQAGEYYVDTLPFSNEYVDEYLFGYAYRLDGNLKEERYGYQTVYDFYATAGRDLGGYFNVGRQYIVSGYAKAPEAVRSTEAAFRLRVDVVYYAHGSFNAETKSYYFDFQTGC